MPGPGAATGKPGLAAFRRQAQQFTTLRDSLRNDSEVDPATPGPQRSQASRLGRVPHSKSGPAPLLPLPRLRRGPRGGAPSRGPGSAGLARPPGCSSALKANLPAQCQPRWRYYVRASESPPGLGSLGDLRHRLRVAGDLDNMYGISPAVRGLAWAG